MIAPAIGATQNSHSSDTAYDGPNSAGPVLRAGFTEVLVTGIDTRWISVRHRPMAMPAKPAAARRAVAPRITIRNTAVITTSLMSAAVMLYLPGECSP
ncbi:hypothetical protein D9M70_599830 [compost metagenome]